jgi:hypothetical protein
MLGLNGDDAGAEIQKHPAAVPQMSADVKTKRSRLDELAVKAT